MRMQRASIWLLLPVIFVFPAAGCGGKAAVGPGTQDPGMGTDSAQEGGAPYGREGASEPRDGSVTDTGVTDADLSTPLPCPTAADPFSFGPVTWPEDQGNMRWQINATSVADAPNSKTRPVEVCGVGGELAWLMQVTCPDGTHPFSDPTSAHNARVGNVGPGGRCEKIIDLYIVPCSGSQYEVYMDMYHCTPSESFN
jgi:hypothetical protein